MIWLVSALLLVAGFALGGWLGAPFLPTRRRDLGGIFDLADMKPGQTLVEMGAGSGTVMAEAARRGIRAVGYEINPWLWLAATLRLWPYRRLVRLKLGDFWQADLSSADAVYVFLIPGKMERLRMKLESANRPLKVVSYSFRFPGLKPVAGRNNYWLYRFPNRRA